MNDLSSDLELPGFRFHPTEEELLHFYLKNMIFGKKLRYDIIGVLNIYQYDPWDLPALAKIGEREWYFFVPRDRKHGSGGRPNRTTEHGFWKATGTDRKIFGLSNPKKMIGLKKTLVFYKGRAPRGCKTDWVMNEYRLPDNCPSKDIVLCKVYRKATSLKVLEQAAMQEIANTNTTNSFHDQTTTPPPPPLPSIPLMDTVSLLNSQHDCDLNVATSESRAELKKEDEEVQCNDESLGITRTGNSSSIQLPTGYEILGDLQVPKFNIDWSQVPLWTPLRSPWLDNLTPYAMF